MCVCIYKHVFIYVCYTLVSVPGKPLSSYRLNLKNVCVCVCVCVYYTFIVVSAVGMETRIMRMYVCIIYYSINGRQPFT